MTNEFKKVKNDNETRYVLETATAGATSAGVVATAPGQKRDDSILAQEASKKKDTPKPRNFVAKNAKMGGAGKMQDKSKTIPRKEKHKKPVSESFNGEYDDEAGMAHSNLLSSARAVMGLLKTIKDRDNLPEWGQEKIAKAEMMLVSVWDYLQSQKQMGNDPQQDVAEGGGPAYIDNMMNQYKSGIGQATAGKPARGVDAKGRTQRQWMDLVKAKFPDAKVMQAKMQDGPVQAILPDGRKLSWNKVEKAAAEGYNPNSVSAQHRREIQSHHEAEIEKKAKTGDPDAVKRLELMKKHKERRANDYNARMEREGVEEGDYYDKWKTGQDARDDKRSDMFNIVQQRGTDRANMMSRHSHDTREKAHQRQQDYLDKLHTDRMSKPALGSGGGSSTSGGIYGDEERAHQAQQRMNRDEYDTQRRKDSDDDTRQTINMFRDRLNRMQYANQRNVDPEQIARLNAIKYEPSKKEEDSYMEGLSTSLASVLQEKAPPGDKYERMVKHIKKGYSKDGKISDKEKSIAYATAWKSKNKSKK